MTEQIYFEHPLNERIRTFLRIEHACEKIDYFRQQSHYWATRAAIESLLDLVAITARTDIKNELIRELDRSLTKLQQFRLQAQVDVTTLDHVVAQLRTAAQQLANIEGPIAAVAREDEFLKTIAQRNSIPGGACSFDLPHYHYCLMQTPTATAQLLERWTADMTPMRDAIRLVLSLARTSATPRDVIAVQGFFQETLDAAAPAQLVRVGLAAGAPYYPEISGHKNRFSIRFFNADTPPRPTPCLADIAFTLTCCAF